MSQATPPAETDGPLWERQPGETSRAYSYFCIYRDMGPSRTREGAFRLHRGYNPTDTNISETSPWRNVAGRWRWKERALAYDAWADRQARSRREQDHYAELEKFRTGQQVIAKNTRIVGLALIAKLHEAVKIIDPSRLTPPQIAQLGTTAARLLDVATNAEAEAVGVDEIRKLLGDMDTSQSATARGGVGGSSGEEESEEDSLFADDWDDDGQDESDPDSP